MKKVNLLSRAEMRKVMGGYMEEGGDGDSPKVAACKDKKVGEQCAFGYQNSAVPGCCYSFAASQIYCSSLVTTCYNRPE